MKKVGPKSGEDQPSAVATQAGSNQRTAADDQYPPGDDHYVPPEDQYATGNDQYDGGDGQFGNHQYIPEFSAFSEQFQYT